MAALVQLKQKSAASAVELRIGALAKATAKTQRALRLYEELDLLTPAAHTAGGFRVYGIDAVERVRWIGKLQDLGFTLTDIQSLIHAGEPERMAKEAMAQVRRVFADKQRELTLQIERLQQLKAELTSSLSYLETCTTACTADASQGTACCGTCETHGGERVPSLVQGARS
jgi:DNA-binding transcriptional MerR regulator